MVAFGERALWYQVGLLLLLVATALMATGMAVPWWAQTHSKATHTVTRHSGLWLGCSTAPEEECSPIDAPDWFKAVQALQCLSLIAMLVGCVYGVFTNCCLDHANFSRVVEISAGTGGLLGMVSCMLYVAKTSHVLRQSNDISYSWAFGVDVAACVFVTFVAAIIALANSRLWYEEGTRIIIDGEDEHQPEVRTRSRLRPKPRADVEERGMEMVVQGRSPARLARLGGTSTEAVVLQNYCGDDPQIHPPVASDSVEMGRPAPFSAPPRACATCACSWHCCLCRQAIVPSTGVAQSCPGTEHVSRCSPYCPQHRCSPSTRLDCVLDGYPATSIATTARANGTSTPLLMETMSQAEPSPLLMYKSSHACPERNHPTSLPPPYSTGYFCSGDRVPVHSQSTACHVHEERKGEGEVERLEEKVNTDRYPRIVATAPPLLADYGDDVVYPTSQYAMESQTVCVGDGPGRQQ